MTLSLYNIKIDGLILFTGQQKNKKKEKKENSTKKRIEQFHPIRRQISI